MDFKKALDIINTIEEQFQVETWTVHGIHVWPILRLELVYKLYELERPPNFSLIEVKQNCFERWFAQQKHSPAAMRLHSLDGKMLKRPFGKYDYIVLAHTDARIPMRGKFYDRVCDSFIDELKAQGKRVLKIERLFSWRFPRYSQSWFVPRDAELNQDLHIIERSQVNELAWCEALDFYLKERFGQIELPSLYSIYNRVQLLLRWKQYYLDLLQECNAKIAFVYTYCNLNVMAFILACRQRGIRSVEIPHGWHTREHASYGRWSRIPPQGYELLPEVFWCWGSQEERSIQEWIPNGCTAHQTFIGGNHLAQAWLHKRHDAYAYYKNKLAKYRSKHNSELIVLTAFIYYDESIETLIESCPKSWTWFIRLHPIQYSNYQAFSQHLQSKGIANIEFEIPSTFPLYALFEFVDVFVAEQSSAVTEAAMFGVPSVTTKFWGPQVSPLEHEQGIAVNAPTWADVPRMIMMQINRFKKEKYPQLMFHDVSTLDIIHRIEALPHTSCEMEQPNIHYPDHGGSVCIFGTGTGGERAAKQLFENETLVGFFDNDKQKHGTQFCGKPVFAPEDIQSIDFDYIIIASMYREVIAQQLVDLGVDKGKIFLESEAILIGNANRKNTTALLCSAQA